MVLASLNNRGDVQLTNDDGSSGGSVSPLTGRAVAVSSTGNGFVITLDDGSVEQWSYANGCPNFERNG
jgi:hypothetical protein